MTTGRFALGALAGAVGVALGVFGAHALKSRVTEDRQTMDQSNGVCWHLHGMQRTEYGFGVHVVLAVC